MKRLLFTTLALQLLLVVLMCGSAFGDTYYVTQAGAGGTTGADCANAISIATFNSSASGGNTYVICSGETITTTILPVNSGTSGNPIILSSGCRR